MTREVLNAVPCICEAGDPCDYHAATCITCERPCKGHPFKPAALEWEQPERCPYWHGGPHGGETVGVKLVKHLILPLRTFEVWVCEERHEFFVEAL